MRSAHRPRARLLPPLAAAALMLLAAACGSESAAPSASSLDSASISQDTAYDASLVQILQREERFRLFHTMLDSAGYLNDLRQGGPFTVFAPTSPALDQMSEGLVEELLLPDNRDRLRQIVAYHVHRGSPQRDSLRGMTSLSTLTDQPLPVTLEGGRLLVGNERTSEYAITARDSSRLYAMDALVMPPPEGVSAPAPAAAMRDTLGSDNSAGMGSSNDGGSGDGGTDGSSPGSSSSGGSSSGG